MIAAVCFWACAVLVTYAYVGYPVAVFALSRAFGRRRQPSAAGEAGLPTVSLILAAYNEDAVITDRLRDALAADYPRDKFEVLVGSDGSTDGTAQAVRRFAGEGVRLLDFAHNRGKASVLNSAVAEATGEILLFSDANTATAPDATRRLVRWFADPTVGAVVGRLVLTDPVTGRNVDGLYWRYETFLKRCEGRLGALLGANGAIYAMRRDLYTPIPAGTVVDDFVIPLLARQRTGCAIVYDCEAVATEETPPDVRSEFRRRARIGAGGFQSITMLWRLLDPRRGWVAFTFASHKVLRWSGPFLLIGALAASLALWGTPFYRVCFLAQLAFYLASWLLAYLPPGAGVPKPLRLATMFTGMNLALLVGFWGWASGRQKATWTPTDRAGGPREAVR